MLTVWRVKLLVGGLALDGLPDPHPEGVCSLEVALWERVSRLVDDLQQALFSVMPVLTLVLWEILPKKYDTVIHRHT